MVKEGLQAVQGGHEVAKKATAEIEQDGMHPELRELLQIGHQTSQQWGQRIQTALSEVGGAEGMENPVLEAVYEVSQKIRQSAQDDLSRDLGIIASSQIALHYWIAAFGTLRTYASSLGMTQTEQSLQKCLDEAKQGDLQHTTVAERILSEVS